MRIFLVSKAKSNLLITIIIASLIAAVAVTGCATTGKVEETEKNVEEKEIVLAAPRDLAPGEKDAFYLSSILYVWEPLVSVGDNGDLAPKLAKSWSMSEDAKEWIFELRDDVTFHDGVKFNADAVIANFERYKKMNPKQSTFYTFDVEKVYPGLKEVTKIDDYKIKITFDKPMPTLPYNMANFGSAMYSPANFAENADFSGLPKGTGPFKLVEHKKDEYIVLEANEAYYGEKAKTKKVRIKVIPDPETRFSALKAEEIMGVMDLGAITPVLAQELLKDDRFSASVNKSTITHYLSPNGNKAPFDDPKMKEAVSLMIDRELIVKEFYGGYPKPTINILNYASPFAKDIKPVYDPEKAKKLAKEALKDKTMEIDLILPSWALDRYSYKTEAEYMQAVLKDLGLTVNIKVLDGAAFKEAQEKGEFHLAMHIQGLPDLEPYTIFDRFMSSRGATNKAYNLGFKNERVDELLKMLDTTLDLNQRKKIYDELQDISAKDFSTIPLFHDVTLIVYNKAITGYEATIYGTTLPQMEWRK